VLVLLLAAACDDDAGGPADGGSCHHDCFSYVTCENGVATRHGQASIPCAEWTGSCPIAGTYQCERGCGAATLSEPSTCAAAICNEHLPKQPGATCAGDGDCQPTAARRTSNGGVTQTYLRCDASTSRCVEADPPLVMDWLRRCDPAVLAGREPGTAGAVADPSCAGGQCVFVVPRDQTCVFQGCSRACSGDQDCPPGSVCQDPTSACSPGPPRAGYCKPGPRDELGVGLLCY
jgi:hypothetical protein